MWCLFESFEMMYRLGMCVETCSGITSQLWTVLTRLDKLACIIHQERSSKIRNGNLDLPLSSWIQA